MSIVVEGAKELEKKLKGLSGKLFEKVIKTANTELMKPVTQDIKAAARAAGGSGSGKITVEVANALAKAISRKTKVYRKDGNIVTVVGPKFGASVERENGKVTQINYLEVEFGEPKKGLSAQGYMRKGWEKNASKVESKYAKAVEVGLAKIAGKK